MGDFVANVVHGIAENIEGLSVGPHDNEILDVPVFFLHTAMDRIVKNHAAV